MAPNVNTTLVIVPAVLGIVAQVAAVVLTQALASETNSVELLHVVFPAEPLKFAKPELYTASEAAGADQLAAVADVAVSTWFAAGVPEMATP